MRVFSGCHMKPRPQPHMRPAHMPRFVASIYASAIALRFQILRDCHELTAAIVIRSSYPYHEFCATFHFLSSSSSTPTTLSQRLHFEVVPHPSFSPPPSCSTRATATELLLANLLARVQQALSPVLRFDWIASRIAPPRAPLAAPRSELSHRTETSSFTPSLRRMMLLALPLLGQSTCIVR